MKFLKFKKSQSKQENIDALKKKLKASFNKKDYKECLIITNQLIKLFEANKNCANKEFITLLNTKSVLLWNLAINMRV